MTKHESEILRWFFSKLFYELTIIGFGFWLVLFMLENLKAGIVSNYISLPMLALGIFVVTLGALWFAKEPESKQYPKTWTKSEILIHLLISIMLVILIPLMVHESFTLTMVLIIVSISTTWLITASIKNNKI